MKGINLLLALSCTLTLTGCIDIEPIVEVAVIVEEVEVLIPIEDIRILDDGCIEYTYEGVMDITCKDTEEQDDGGEEG